LAARSTTSTDPVEPDRQPESQLDHMIARSKR
jgi:hypothetical protein